ncbi:BTAD domain-containing putative transcriptional regulator [Streptomyces luteireticuli]|uniref:BTAD domain-containing putative transcriptional regulator n=1 Tax=Streptomyces luteireticuli TaxID=173858 RepID=UPI003557BAB1
MSVRETTIPLDSCEGVGTVNRPAAAGPSALRLRVLGQISARYGASDLVLGPRRHRALLALLTIRPGRVVPTGLLIEELWGAAPPRRPVATLQTYVSHLRRALDPVTGCKSPSVLNYRAPGYILQLSPEQVDAHRFETLVRSGRRLLDGQDASGARNALTEALSLWDGCPYQEFEELPVLADEYARLEQVRLTAVESLAQARLTLGEAAAVATELAPEARRYPMREHLIGHLMTALSDIGCQAEALRVYERTRACLAEEFGVDAGAELKRVHAAVLRQESRRRTAVPAVAAPGPVVSVRVPVRGSEVFRGEVDVVGVPAGSGCPCPVPGPSLSGAQHGAVRPDDVSPADRPGDDGGPRRLTGVLRVATLQSISIGVMPPALRILNREQPGIRLVLTEYINAGELHAALESGEADLAVGPLPDMWHHPVHLLGTEEFVIVLPPDDPCTLPVGTRVPFSALRDRKWVRLAPRNGLARFLDEACAAAGFRPGTAIYTEQSAAAPLLTLSGLGPSLIPANMLPPHFAGRVFLPEPPIRRTLAAYSCGRPDAVATVFIETLVAGAHIMPPGLVDPVPRR